MYLSLKMTAKIYAQGNSTIEIFNNKCCINSNLGKYQKVSQFNANRIIPFEPGHIESDMEYESMILDIHTNTYSYLVITENDIHFYVKPTECFGSAKDLDRLYDMFMHGNNGNNIICIELPIPIDIAPGHTLFDPKKISRICSGLKFIYILTNDGRLFGLGNNEFNQFCCPTPKYSVYPIEIFFQNILHICAGNNYAVIITTSGAYLTGWWSMYGLDDIIEFERYENYRRIVSLDGFVNNIAQIYAESTSIVFLTKDNKVYCLGSFNFNKYRVPHQIDFGAVIVKIVVGWQTIFALSDDGRLFTVGSNYNGQLGLAGIKNIDQPMIIPDLSNVIDISCGYEHMMAIDADYKIYTWGMNLSGQLCRDLLIRSNDIPGLYNTGLARRELLLSRDILQNMYATSSYL